MALTDRRLPLGGVGSGTPGRVGTEAACTCLCLPPRPSRRPKQRGSRKRHKPDNTCACSCTCVCVHACVCACAERDRERGEKTEEQKDKGVCRHRSGAELQRTFYLLFHIREDILPLASHYRLRSSPRSGDPKHRAGSLIGSSLIHLCNIPVQNDV